MGVPALKQSLTRTLGFAPSAFTSCQLCDFERCFFHLYKESRTGIYLGGGRVYEDHMLASGRCLEQHSEHAKPWIRLSPIILMVLWSRAKRSGMLSALLMLALCGQNELLFELLFL